MRNCIKSFKSLKILLLVLVAAVLTSCGTDLIESSEVKRDVLKLCGAGSDYSTSDVKVLDWDYNSDMVGNTYTGYIVTYEIGTGYYALVSLVEFEESSRYEIELVYRGRSLTDLRDYVYDPF